MPSGSPPTAPGCPCRSSTAKHLDALATACRRRGRDEEAWDAQFALVRRTLGTLPGRAAFARTVDVIRESGAAAGPRIDQVVAVLRAAEEPERFHEEIDTLEALRPE